MIPKQTPERLVVVTNPNSTQNNDVEQDVLLPLRHRGVSFVHHETSSPDTATNTDDLREVLQSGDTVIVTGGDGTKMQAANAALAANLENVQFAMLPYGNYNDLATRNLSIDDIISGNVERYTVHPLSIEVNGTFERWAPSYATLGFTALLAETFSQPATREKLTGHTAVHRKLGNLAELGAGYFAHRDTKLPPFRTSKSLHVHRAVTDVLLLNSKKAGGIIRSHDAYGALPYFGYREADVSTIMKNIPFGLAALAGRAPASRVSEMRIIFEHATSVPFQSEGEFKLLDNVSDIFVYKDPGAALTLLTA